MYTPSKSTLKSLETSFQHFIRKSCKLESKYRQRMVDTYTSFFNSIAKATTNFQFRLSKIQYDNSWTLFTTNYDRCLEAFWRNNARIDQLDTGFRDRNGSISSYGTLRPDWFLYSYGSELQFLKNGQSYLRLVKLHGSATWLKREDTGEIEEKEFNIDHVLSS